MEILLAADLAAALRNRTPAAGGGGGAPPPPRRSQRTQSIALIFAASAPSLASVVLPNLSFRKHVFAKRSSPRRDNPRQDVRTDHLRDRARRPPGQLLLAQGR